MHGPLTAAGLKDFNGSINLSASFTGKDGDLILASGSVDQTGTYVFEVEPQGVASSLSKYSNYWGVANGNDTMFSLWNPTDTPQDIVATFYFGDGSGKYTLPVHLDPQASSMIDMAMLIMEMKPDGSGNIIPPSVQEGSAQFASAKGSHEKITLVVAGGIYNVSTATCGNTCTNCCGLSNFGINPVLVPIGASMLCEVTTVDCNGNQVYPNSWSTSDSAIMTVDISNYAHGVSVGSVTITGIYSFAPVYTGQVCNTSCPTSNPAPTASGDTISLTCSPSSVTRGSSTTCTVSGASSGATFSNWKFTDASNNTVSGSGTSSSWAGTMVTGGTVSVTVSSSGSNHYAFYSNGLSSNNLGDYVESRVAPPGTNTSNFDTDTGNGLSADLTAIGTAAAVQPYAVNESETGVLLGNINYSPYASCQ